MITDKITTTDYKYHIYELVGEKWLGLPAYKEGIKSLPRVKKILSLWREKYPHGTFKLVTEKITTVHEFEEESVAAPTPPKIKSCNRHYDCDSADAEARTKGRFDAEHCHDDCCEECFGY